MEEGSRRSTLSHPAAALASSSRPRGQRLLARWRRGARRTPCAIPSGRVLRDRMSRAGVARSPLRGPARRERSGASAHGCTRRGRRGGRARRLTLVKPRAKPPAPGPPAAHGGIAARLLPFLPRPAAGSSLGTGRYTGRSAACGRAPRDREARSRGGPWSALPAPRARSAQICLWGSPRREWAPPFRVSGGPGGEPVRSESGETLVRTGI